MRYYVLALIFLALLLPSAIAQVDCSNIDCAASSTDARWCHCCRGENCCDYAGYSCEVRCDAMHRYCSQGNCGCEETEFCCTEDDDTYYGPLIGGFHESTLINMSSGLKKPIYQVVAGDQVRAFNRADASYSDVTVQKVYASRLSGISLTYTRLNTQSGSILRVANNQPVFVRTYPGGNHRWAASIPGPDFQTLFNLIYYSGQTDPRVTHLNDEVRNMTDGSYVPITAITSENSGNLIFYNLQIGPPGTFYAYDFLVHGIKRTGTVCGDTICEEGESCASCDDDCNCPVFCPDGICQDHETASSCPADCSDISTGIIVGGPKNHSSGIYLNNWETVLLNSNSVFITGSYRVTNMSGARWLDKDPGNYYVWTELEDGYVNYSAYQEHYYSNIYGLKKPVTVTAGSVTAADIELLWVGNCGDSQCHNSETCDPGYNIQSYDYICPARTLTLANGVCRTGQNPCTYCGDGAIQEPSEECEAGNLNGENCITLNQGFSGGILTCGSNCAFDTSQCTYPADPTGSVCGNGQVEAGEECDDGNTFSNDQCSNDCEWTFCGDYLRQTPNGYNQNEGCDDGDNDPGDGCSASCQEEYGWECAEDASGHSTCTTDCGDGILVSGQEVCDEGALNGIPCTPSYNGICDFCASDCNEVSIVIASYCGNDNVETTFESCDPGIATCPNGADCSNNNKYLCPTTCTAQASPTCSASCQPLATCGDGAVQAGEQCELPDSNNNGACDQSDFSLCVGNKRQYPLDDFGYCNYNCQCTNDTVNPSTAVCDQTCGAACDSDSDCDANYDCDQSSCTCVFGGCNPGFCGTDCHPAPTWYKDEDSDAYHPTGGVVTQCDAPYGPGWSTTVKQPGDCNDADQNIRPGLTEVCDTLDNNCNSQTDEGCDPDQDTYRTQAMQCIGLFLSGTSQYSCSRIDCQENDPSKYQNRDLFLDADQDTYTRLNSYTICTNNTLPAGYVLVRSALIDCDDNDPAVTIGNLYYQDLDGDSYGNPNQNTRACAQPINTVLDHSDCNDNFPGGEDINPGVDEYCGDNIDNDCSGSADDGCACNAGDIVCDTHPGVCAGYSQTCGPDGVVPACQWNTIPNYQATEMTCDLLDNDCDGLVDEGCDDDHDGHVEQNMTCNLQFRDGSGNTVSCARRDCNDNERNMNYNATEVCDNLDNNCDGTIDNILPQNLPICTSMEKYQGRLLPLGVCLGAVASCDSLNKELICDIEGHELPLEISCDELDNDCDGVIDEGCACTPGSQKQCGSDLGECVSGRQICSDDGLWGECEGSSGPAAETCDNLDNNCDGAIDNGLTRECTNNDCPGQQTCSQGEWGECAASCKEETPLDMEITSNDLAVWALETQKSRDEIKGALKTLAASNQTTSSSFRNGETKIKNTFNPSKGMKNVELTMFIPKCLTSHLADIEFDNPDYKIIQEDPIIAWHFVEAFEPIDLNYKIKGEISEDCLEQIKGMPIAEVIGIELKDREDTPLWKLAATFLIIISIVVVVIYLKKNPEPIATTESDYHEQFITRERAILLKKIQSTSPKSAEQADKHMMTMGISDEDRQWILKRLRF